MCPNYFILLNSLLSLPFNVKNNKNGIRNMIAVEGAIK